ncbi:MAG: hypothetical protein IKB88_02465 [Clostridia bacterium]|nr:hypothetical protein [Clostridia bacterium]
MKKILALILAIASVFSLATFSASAEDADENTVVITRGDMDFVFEAGVSEDLMNSFIHSVETDHDDCEDTAAYGLMCTLFGHKIESSTAHTITHNAKTTAPRCLKNTYYVEACTRCDYTAKELIRSEYISCC